MRLKLKETGSDIASPNNFDQMDLLEIVDKIWFMIEKQERANVDFMNMPSSIMMHPTPADLESSSSSIPMLHEKYEKEL